MSKDNPLSKVKRLQEILATPASRHNITQHLRGTWNSYYAKNKNEAVKLVDEVSKEELEKNIDDLHYLLKDLISRREYDMLVKVVDKIDHKKIDKQKLSNYLIKHIIRPYDILHFDKAKDFESKREAIFNFFIDKGLLDPNGKTKEGKTMLDQALESTKDSPKQMLYIKKLSELGSKDKNGNTCLHRLVSDLRFDKMSDKDLRLYLLELITAAEQQGKDLLSTKNKDGKTPIDLAKGTSLTTLNGYQLGKKMKEAVTLPQGAATIIYPDRKPVGIAEESF